MTIFGEWLRDRNRRAARALNGDPRALGQLAAQEAADPLGIDLEATRQILEARIQAEERRQAMVAVTRPVPCVGTPDGCREGIRVAKDAPEQTFVCSPRCEKRVQVRKEASILAALVFGCSCGSRWWAPFGLEWGAAESYVARWLRAHSQCAGLGAMVRA